MQRKRPFIIILSAFLSSFKFRKQWCSFMYVSLCWTNYTLFHHLWGNSLNSMHQGFPFCVWSVGHQQTIMMHIKTPIVNQNWSLSYNLLIGNSLVSHMFLLFGSLRTYWLLPDNEEQLTIFGIFKCSQKQHIYIYSYTSSALGNMCYHVSCEWPLAEEGSGLKGEQNIWTGVQLPLSKPNKNQCGPSTAGAPVAWYMSEKYK